MRPPYIRTGKSPLADSVCRCQYGMSIIPYSRTLPPRISLLSGSRRHYSRRSLDWVFEKQKVLANRREPFQMAEWTGLEPATPGVTGRYSNQLNYHSSLKPEYNVKEKKPPLPRNNHHSVSPLPVPDIRIRTKKRSREHSFRRPPSTRYWRSGRDSNPRPPA